MKNYFYRSLAHTRQNSGIHLNEQTPFQIYQLYDQKLHYINRSFKHNLQIQQIFLDITKTKRTLHSKEIKQYYKLFTQNKADSEIFHNTLQETQRQNIEGYLHTGDAGRSLKRLYCRLIQKMMVKLSFYMMNKQRLSFMYKQVNQMMKKCETLIRRVNYMRDLHSINQLIQEVYRQNEYMQIKIIQELIGKGFIISIDQFYRINGVDVIDKQMYERIKSDLDEDEEEEMRDQEIDEKLSQIKKFQFNINKKSSFQRMTKQEVATKKKDTKKHVHRAGYIQIQNKYRDLLVHLQNLIKNDLIDQIAEEKEQMLSSDSNIRQSAQKQSLVESVSEEIKPQSINSPPKQQNLRQKEKQPEIQNLQEDQKLKQQQQRTSQLNQYTKKSSMINNSKDNSYYECKSEFRQKDINLSSVQSSSHISDILNNRGARSNSHKQNSDYFSKSFIGAIQTMQKVNINDKTNRLAIKRMSEHILSFHKQSEYSSNADTNRSVKQVNISNVLRLNNEKKSIIKLVNIYQSRKFKQQIHSMQKQFNDYKDKIVKKDEIGASTRAKQNKLSLFYEKKNEMSQICQQKTISNIINYPKIPDAKESYKDFAQFKMSQFQMNSVFKQIPKDIKIQQQISKEYMKKFQKLKAKIRFTSKDRTPQFQNARLSHKIQRYDYQFQSPTSSPSKNKSNKMQANSLLTSKGIQTVDYDQYKSLICDQNDKIKMCKTALVQRNIQIGRYEIYDRNRRVVLR